MDKAYSLIRRHRYIVLGIMCVLFALSTACSNTGINAFSCVAVPVAAAGLTIVLRGCFSLNKKHTAAAACISLGVLAGCCALIGLLELGCLIVRLLCALGSIAVLLLLWKKKLLNSRTVLVTAVIMGIALRVLAVLECSVENRQHDVYSFSQSQDTVYSYSDRLLDTTQKSGAGHAGYIEYIFHHGRLPDFDMRNVWSFYNPPFFHITAALWLRFAVLFFDYPMACESIQVISLFSSCAVILLSLRLFRLIGLKGRGLAAAAVMVCASNTIISFALNANNDPPAFMLSLAAVIFTADWYRSRKMKDILKTALALGLAMMTKLSSALLAFPIGAVFVFAFVSDAVRRKGTGKYLIQFPAFLAVCAPLGLFYQVRNLIRFGIPMNYIQTVDDLLPEQYIGNIPVLKRLFTAPPDLLMPPWVHTLSVNGMDRYTENDYNPLVMLFKTALYEEYQQNPASLVLLDIAAMLLLIILAIVSVVSVIKLLQMIFVTRGEQRILHLFLAAILVSSLISYYVFCFRYPYLCSQHIRYIPLTVIIISAYTGFAVSDLKPAPLAALKTPKQLSRQEKLHTGAFAAMTVLIAILSYWQLLIF